MIDDQFRRLVKFFNDKHMESNPTDEWDENSLANLPRMNKENSIWRLLDKHIEDAIIVVGASPCLMEDVKVLAKFEEHPLRNKFIVIVVNAALKVCLQHGVKPDYVIAIDGNPATIVDDLDCDNENLKLICTNSVAPQIFDVWRGKEVWWIPYYSLSKKVMLQVRKKLGRKMPTGGNNFSSAMAIGYGVMGARIYIMVGSEHCYDKQYYAHKKSKWETATDNSHWKTKDIRGRERWTNIPLWQYKVWIEKMATELPHVVFIDTSWGILGTDTERIRHKNLDEALQETTEAFDLAEKAKNDPSLLEKLRYDEAYATGKYIPEIGIDFWRKLMKRSKFPNAKKILDVGTGIGQVVAHLRNEGFEAYGTDIADSVRPYWMMGNIVPFCRVCPAHQLPYKDGEFDIVSCTEVLEHIPEEYVLPSLKEIYRVGNGDFIMTYALGKAMHKMPNDFSEPHVTIKSMTWWTEKMQEAGFNIIDVMINPTQTSGTVYATKGIRDAKGKMPTRTMFIQSKEGMYLGGRFADFQGSNRLPVKGNRGLHGVRSAGASAG
jgi:SAM-dependent methyltransferase